MISGTIQIVFGICLVIILFIIGFATYNYEFIRAIQQSSNSILLKSVPIFEGIKDSQNTTPEIYTVADKRDPSYRDIQPSVNQKGGIEFSYSFWLFNKTPEAPTNTAPVSPDVGNSNDSIVLFVKGSNKLFSYNNICNETKTDYKIKCPLVKLENGRTHLTVEFNTLVDDTTNYPEAIKQGYRSKCNDSTTDWEKANTHKLTIGNLDKEEFKEKWVLVTVVIKDTVPSDLLPNRNKAHCAIYLNNFMELDTYVDGLTIDMSKTLTTVKPNMGSLYVFPNTPSTITNPKDLMIANLTYHNYAIDQKTIESIYSSGVPKYTAAAVAAGETYDNAYEISNMYNESLTSDEAIERRKKKLQPAAS